MPCQQWPFAMPCHANSGHLHNSYYATHLLTPSSSDSLCLQTFKSTRSFCRPNNIIAFLCVLSPLLCVNGVYYYMFVCFSCSYVRQGVLYGLGMMLWASPAHTLLELGAGLTETVAWMKEVSSQDADEQCRTLAVYALGMLNETMKK